MAEAAGEVVVEEVAVVVGGEELPLRASVRKDFPWGNPFHPRNLLLQWHITEHCNGHCRHCYQDASLCPPDLPFTDLISILDQFLALLDSLDQKTSDGKTKAHITIAGGEPFLHKDCLDLLDLLAVHSQQFSFAILTNGTTIDSRLARYLARLRPRFVQVSVDGGQETHDRVRGSGNFEKVSDGVKHLVRAGVPTFIAFTAHHDNYHEFPQVVRHACHLGATLVWADRFLPLGEGGMMRELVLSPEETREFTHIVASSRLSRWSRLRWRTRVAARRALQFLGTGGKPYSCQAGSTLLTVMSNGDLVPCRRMPIVMGNLLQQRLIDLYQSHPVLHSLREPGTVIAGCEKCQHSTYCRGGLRCLSYSLHGDPFKADPGCWLADTTTAEIVE